MNQNRDSLLRAMLRNLGILLLAMVVAVLARKFLLGALETRIVWVTFYPAVVIAAFYGGWITGLLSAVASCLLPVAAQRWVDFDGEALAALPPALRTELADALVSLDAARIAGLIRHVAELNSELGGALEHHANQFRYTIILRALQACRGGALKAGATV